MKKAVSIITAIALLLTLSISTFAKPYSYALPEVSTNAGRSPDFASGSGIYSPTLKQDAGTVTYDNEADDKISGGKGLLVMQRFLEDGELYWQDYVNGVYGCGDGFIELPITKSSAQDAVQINTNGLGYTVMVEWANDGKLYAKNRKNASDSTATNWNYICDIDGLSAKLTFYIYSDLDCYYIAVNDKIVSGVLYSMDTNPSKSELVRITYVPGTTGTVWVDYKEMGSVTTHSLIPAGVEIDAENVEDGSIRVKSSFLGAAAASACDWKVYTALYDLTGELISVYPESVASSIEGDTVIQNIDFGDLNYKNLYAKRFLWTDNQTPVAAVATKYFYTTPAMTSVERVDNFDNGDLSSGGQFELAGKEGEAFATINEANGKANIIRNGTDGYAAITAWMAGGNNKTSGIVSFTISKSSKEAVGQFRLLPSEYVAFAWGDDGSISACYRDSAEQLGTDALWHTVKSASDDLSVDVVIAYNGADSSYSMWLDGVPVVVNKYSRAVYNGQHSVPTFINQVRFYSEGGNAGDTISLSNYRFGYGAGYGA